MNCRCCGNSETTSLGVYKPYTDYECELFDCPMCGCRMAPRNSEIYELLHAYSDITYSGHEAMAQLTEIAFNNKDISLMRSIIKRMGHKYEWVVCKLASNAKVHRVLEVGCSKGYLTAYLVLAGYDAIGIDVSESAITSATSRFGNHFEICGEIPAKSPNAYDAIVHTGTIGCVDNPAEFTRHLISMLKPGGELLFNAPNVQECHNENCLWNRGTTPPDLVTLFSKHYWNDEFSDIAQVEVINAPLEGRDDLIAVTYRLLKIHRSEKTLTAMFGSGTTYSNRTEHGTPSFFRMTAKSAISSMLKLLPNTLQVHSMYVNMSRK